jgi:hypothetical protein
MEPSEHDKIPLCKILYFIGDTGKDGECTIDQEMVLVQGSL